MYNMFLLVSIDLDDDIRLFHWITEHWQSMIIQGVRWFQVLSFDSVGVIDTYWYRLIMSCSQKNSKYL